MKVCKTAHVKISHNRETTFLDKNLTWSLLSLGYKNIVNEIMGNMGGLGKQDSMDNRKKKKK